MAALGSAAVLASAAGGAAVVLSSAPAGANAPIVVDSLADDGTGTTLRDAIDQANTDGGKDTITFSVSGTITLASSLPKITDAVDITGPGEGSLTVDGASSSAGFYFGGIAAVAGTSSLTGMTITGMNSVSLGGALRWEFSDADFTLSDVTLTDNYTASNGGAIDIFYASGSIVIDHVTATGNSAGLNGGALYLDAYDGSLTPLTISHSTFTGNSASGGTGGGAMVLNTADVTITDTVITGNTVTGNDAGGGGVNLGSGTVAVLDGVTVDDNTVSGTSADGGGIRVYDAALTLLGSSVSGNAVPSGSGGAISAHGASSLYVGSSTLAGNTAGYYGGALYLLNSGGRMVVNSTISGNSAAQAGAAFSSDSGGLGVLQSTITGNTATAPGVGTQAVGGIQAVGGVGSCDAVVACVASVPAGVVYLAGSILVGNTDVDLGTTSRGTISASSEGSIIGVVETGPVTVTDFGGTQFGVTAAALKLGPLADNGGPTLTHALLAGSPAIDAGPVSEFPFPGDAWDQRGEGYARIQNGRIDVGAFEVQVERPEPVPEPSFTG